MRDIDALRIATIAAGEAEVECQECKWLGSEDNACPGPSTIRRCPECQSARVWDYESALYKAGYR